MATIRSDTEVNVIILPRLSLDSAWKAFFWSVIA
jgi:hypothetical protein